MSNFEGYFWLNWGGMSPGRSYGRLAAGGAVPPSKPKRPRLEALDQVGGGALPPPNQVEGGL
jgi:hypothetical protein